jgi:phosphate-selective porin OprO and OprP
MKTSLLCALAAAGALGSWNAEAADAGSVEERLKKLETQVDGLQMENASLKKELGYDPKKPAAFVRGAGKESKITLGGYLQFMAEFGNAPDGRYNGIEDRFLARRARINVIGSFLENFDYKAEIDFGANAISEKTGYSGQFTDVFLNWNKYEYANLKAGQYKTHFGWEQILSDTKLLTIERSLPNDRLTDGRQIGTSVTGAVLDKRLRYAVGMFNGTGVNNSFNDNDHFMYTARIQGTALKTEWNKMEVEWNVGINALTSKDSGVTKNGFGFDSTPLTVAADNLFFGDRNAWGIDTQAKVGPFDFQAEYIRNRFEPDNSAPANGLESDGWYVLGGYYIVPKHLQAILRFENFDPDRGVHGNTSDVWTFGLNYYIKGDDLKIMANYLYGDQAGIEERKGRLLLMAQVIF